MCLNKRGISHVEVIMSFVLFFGFVSFAFYFFSPFESGRTLDSSLDYAFDEVLENVSTTLESYSVVFPTGCSDQTVKIDSAISGNYFGGTRDGTKFCGFGPGDFITILISEDFTYSAGSCNDVTSPCSSISSSENKKVLSENKIDELKSIYDDDEKYSKIKENFNLPGRIDFGFSLVFDDESSIVAEKEIPSNLEVVAKEDRIEIIRQNGNIEFADLIIKVW